MDNFGGFKALWLVQLQLRIYRTEGSTCYRELRQWHNYYCSVYRSAGSAGYSKQPQWRRHTPYNQNNKWYCYEPQCSRVTCTIDYYNYSLDEPEHTSLLQLHSCMMSDTLCPPLLSWPTLGCACPVLWPSSCHSWGSSKYNMWVCNYLLTVVFKQCIHVVGWWLEGVANERGDHMREAYVGSTTSTWRLCSSSSTG